MSHAFCDQTATKVKQAAYQGVVRFEFFAQAFINWLGVADVAWIHAQLAMIARNLAVVSKWQKFVETAFATV